MVFGIVSICFWVCVSIAIGLSIDLKRKLSKDPL
jgi:hypothetical protein